LVVRVRTQAGSAQADSLERCVRELLRQHDDDDIAAASPDDLLGWSSRHTVIEIVNDDMPFLVDSTTMEINRRGASLHLIVHPIFAVERDGDGQLVALHARGAAGSEAAARESWMHIEIDRQVDAAMRAEVQAGIERVLGDVRAAVEDWRPMLEQLDAVIAECASAPSGTSAEEDAEARAFLQWLRDDHLVLLGYRRHDLDAEGGSDRLRLVRGSALGLLRESDSERAQAVVHTPLPAGSETLVRLPSPRVIVTKANTRSTVHRPGYTDYIGVQALRRAGPRGRRASFHRPVHLDRLLGAAGQRARCCAASWRRWPRAPASCPAATWARRSSMCSRPSRATSCSRSAPTSSTRSRSASCSWANAAAAHLRAPRPLRALHVLPGLRAARGLLHRPAA
jgi:NAD-specific glutamate dehydrogenase